MAVGANKTRIRDTAILVGSCFAVILFSKQLVSHEQIIMHESLEIIGYFMACIAAIGRIYSTAFLGGFKGNKIVDYGPFSVCRNPLYMFSFIGVCGIALMSLHLFVIIIMPLGLLAIYIPLIKREEVILAERFGKTYANYCAKTPRLVPKFALYKAPEKVEMAPEKLLSAVKDSVMWFAAYPLLELIEKIQDAGYIKPLFHLG